MSETKRYFNNMANWVNHNNEMKIIDIRKAWGSEGLIRIRFDVLQACSG